MGVTVLDMRRGGPAYRAGLAIGDSITRVGVTNVYSGADLQRALRQVSAEGTTPVRVSRQGVTRTFMVSGAGIDANGKLARLGVVTEQRLVGKFFKGKGVAPAAAAPAKVGDGAGVPVLRVNNDSPLLGLLQAGDLLLSINGRALNKSEDVASALKQASFEARSSIAYRRQGVRRTCSANFGRTAGGKLRRLGVITRAEAL